ncbi:MAG TPA: GNAT family protein [Bacilli bacterium]|nr:GNAT family protein [Bacilli bacterium]
MTKREGATIYIRRHRPEDADARFALMTRNREFWKRYEPSFENRPELTSELVQEFIKNEIEGWEADKGYHFGIFVRETDELIGSIMIAKVNRGPFDGGIVGYSLDEAHNGKGYATQAVRLVAQFAFEELKLHRLYAGVMPSNIGSWRVLEKAGFVREGLNRKNLKINGEWEDHYAYSMLETDWEKGSL